MGFPFRRPKVNSQHRDQAEAQGQRKVVVGMLLPLDGVAEACPRWIVAVNHWGRPGHWRYLKIHSPHQLEVVLELGGAIRNSAPGAPTLRKPSV